MKQLFTLFICLLCSGALLAQDEPTKESLAPCGTVSGIEPWLVEFTENPGLYQRSNDTLYVALKIHLLANNAGTGRFAPTRVVSAFKRLNEDFAASNIQFYMLGDWNNLDNTAWYNHDDIPTGIDMMFTNNVPDAVNTYFVSDPAGNCGYNLPYAGIAMSHSCSGANDHTWAHEIGHNLKLPHPFIGWEGKLFSNFNPTPDTLTYDYTHFHSVPDTIVPAPLDTATVEYVDQNNCTTAADRICDTKPDYLSYRWDCDANSESLVTQTDPAGATFKSDGTLFMSYSNDICSNRFSPDQIDIMRAHLLDVKFSYLHPGAPAPSVNGVSTLISPINNELVGNQNIELNWTPVEGADRYVVQVSRFAAFTQSSFEMMVSDTTVTIPQLLINFNFYWRVRPFNSLNVGEYSSTGTFKTVFVSSTDETAEGAWACFPSLLEPGESLQLTMPGVQNGARCFVYDAMGRLMFEQELPKGVDQATINMPSQQWATGVYRLVYVGEKQSGSLSFCIK